VSKRTITQRATAIVNEHGPGWWNDYARRHPHSKATTAELRKDMAIYCVEAALQEAGVTSAEHNTLTGLRGGSLVAVPREMTMAMRRAVWLAQFRHANARAQHPRPDEDCALLAEQRVQSATQREQDEAAYAAILAAAKEDKR
jgi:hypothetical protein